MQIWILTAGQFCLRAVSLQELTDRNHKLVEECGAKECKGWKQLILTWHRGHRDHEGGSPRVRPYHCTSVRLTLAITPNVGDSGAQFLLVGDCVRAIPWKSIRC